MGVSKNNGTPKWMVKIMENPIKMDDLGGNTHIFGSTPILYIYIYIWANYNDVSRGHPKWWFSKGIPLKMALNLVKDL